tara:strand:+ start:810 stop:1088 length:279 start_codon:yes stop_codon:yes gene_type:complete
MNTIQLILSILIIACLLYIVWNLLRKVEKLEDGINEVNEVLDSSKESMESAFSRMKEVDRLGSFEADDESGFIFEEIQSALDKLNNQINKNA